MTPRVRVLIISLGCLFVAISITAPLAILLPRRCKGVCADDVLACGTTCETNPKCVGKVCEDPDALCEGGECVVRHKCTSTGACVPDPNGPFIGPTCTCFAAVPPPQCGPACDTADVCMVVGDSGAFATEQTCLARDADFACVPGEGRCERTLGATTGWQNEEECACFECPPNALTCVPTPYTHPTDSIDGEGCLACGRWGCDPNGECVQSVTGGTWDDAAHCSCGLCESGACVPAQTGGGAYASVSECEADSGTRCAAPTLGWSCDAHAGNTQLCRQTVDGGASSVNDCRCWTCTGDWPGPGSGCNYDEANGGEFNTYQSCFDDASKMCGWLYQCNP